MHKSSFLLFLNDCTPEDYNGKDDRRLSRVYMEGVNIDAGSGDIIGDGNPIKGSLGSEHGSFLRCLLQ